MGDKELDFLDKYKVKGVAPLKIICDECGEIKYTQLKLYKKNQHYEYHIPICRKCIRKEVEEQDNKEG